MTSSSRHRANKEKLGDGSLANWWGRFSRQLGGTVLLLPLVDLGDKAGEPSPSPEFRENRPPRFFLTRIGFLCIMLSNIFKAITNRGHRSNE